MALTLPNSKRALIDKAGSSIFIAVSVASIVVAFSVVAINFMWDQAQYNSRVQEGKTLAKDTLEANIENAVALQQDFEQLDAAEDLIAGQGEKANSTLILDALPRKYDFPALRTSLDKLASISGVRLSGFNGDDRESDAIASMVTPTPQVIDFKLTVIGDYEDIKKFVTNVENTIRPIRILQYRTSGSDDSLSASIDFETYYQPSVDINVRTENIQ